MQLVKLCKSGTIEVVKSGYSAEGYPGYFVSLKNPAGNMLAEVLFEVDETVDNCPVCKIHIWDSKHEDPVFNFSGVNLDGEMSLSPYED